MKQFCCLVLLVLLCSFTANAQTRITGTVTGAEDGKPIAFASVLVKNTSTAVTTGEDGTYSITVPDGNAVLVFSFFGMQSREEAVGGRSIVNVALENEAFTLDESMVVAYGVAKKSSYTGSASLVKAEALKDLPTTNFQEALNGKVAGLMMTSSSGQAGGTSSIRIRGIGSMNASNEPLYVVDGVPVSSGNTGQLSDYTYATNNIMNTINPSDIESISVLKDAAAASLYGSRAANGVVIITTKKGKEGKPTINLKASVGFTPSWATDNYEAAGVQEQMNMLYTVLYDYNISVGNSATYANTNALSRLNTKFRKHGYEVSTPDDKGAYANVLISEYDNSGRGGQYFDWEKAYFRTAVYQDYDISVSGGTPTSTYYTSMGYTKDQGRIKVNSFDRISGRVNLSQKLGKIAEVATNVNISRTDNSGYNDTRNTGSNYYMQSRNLLWGVYWPTDYKTGDPWTAQYGSLAYNGLYYQNEWENQSINTRLSAMETLTLHLLPGLDVRSIFSYDNSTVKDHIYYSRKHFSGASAGGTVSEMRTIYEKIVSSTTATYNKTFNGKHNLGLLVGFEVEDNDTDFTRATGSDLPITGDPHTVSMAGTKDSRGYSWGNSIVSVLSKADYNYNERYFASASYRRDGSSKLSVDDRWGNFWSVSGAWNIHREQFMESLKPTLSDLRFRISYGVNGTLPGSNYGYMGLMSYSGYSYMGLPGGAITSLLNDELSWETNYATNIGLDFGFFNQRLKGTIEYFNRNTKNLLQNVPISTTTGFDSILQNVGEINNRGVEIEVSGDILRLQNGLVWSAHANAAFTSTEVKSLYSGADIIWYDPTGSDDRAKYIYREGQPVYAFYGYEWAGVDKTNGKSVYYVNDPDDSTLGDFVYNGRGATYKYSNANNVIIGDATPKVFGGFGTNVAFKGIDLGINFTYKIGGKIYDGAYKDVADDGYYWERTRAQSYYDNMWTPTNTNGSQPRIEGTDLEDAMQYSSRQIHNASFLRLKNLSVGYTIPKSIVSKVKMDNVRVYFNVSNLLTFSKYKEADPEVNAYGTRGWETPIGKTFVFGIDLKF